MTDVVDASTSDQGAEAAADLADALRRSHGTAAAAESLTGGSIASRLAAAEEASEWFRGAVIAYSADAKFDVLGVDPGPVITAECARQMARGALRLLKADFAVSTTGAGGPGSEEGMPAGTVFIGVASKTDCRVAQYHFDGDPAAVVQSTTEQALRDLGKLVLDQ